ncbi:hypothetical protein PF008_g29561 [Phytophthora fragariae]|uniref:Uncharacterized protein n=1 Tax=Phytophthora fragariae TaxID=53985 RepID=A0A6G0Q821_9STRA|nr:hypothetical protein PF008_g29561 [Phytophthora fragariae]
MSAMLPNDEDFLMDESSILTFLADCELDCEVAPISTSSSDLSTPPRHCDTLTTTWSTTTSSTANSSPEKAIAIEPKKLWRQRRKEEVLKLREVVKQLSAELEHLKWTAGVHSTLPSVLETPPAVNAQASHKTEVSVMWERIAGHQSMLRQESEEENAKLRDDLWLQLQQTKRMQRAIKRKLRESFVSSSMDLIKHHRLNTRGVTPPLNSKTVFDQLMVGLDESYVGVEAIFEKGTFVEFLDNYALPFDLRETAKVIWTPKKDQSDLYYKQNFTSGRNTRMESYCDAFSLQGLDLRIIMRSVARKYVEKDRVVFITRTLIEPIYEGASIHSLVETKRMVLRRGNVSAIGPTTVMQSHRDAKILGGIMGFNATTDLPSLHGAGLENWDKNITRFNNNLEDQLIRATS